MELLSIHSHIGNFLLGGLIEAAGKIRAAAPAPAAN
jgi:hypothetical protein